MTSVGGFSEVEKIFRIEVVVWKFIRLSSPALLFFWLFRHIFMFSFSTFKVSWQKKKKLSLQNCKKRWKISKMNMINKKSSFRALKNFLFKPPIVSFILERHKKCHKLRKQISTLEKFQKSFSRERKKKNSEPRKLFSYQWSSFCSTLPRYIKYDKIK